jgi:hypothetical protein
MNQYIQCLEPSGVPVAVMFCGHTTVEKWALKNGCFYFAFTTPCGAQLHLRLDDGNRTEEFRTEKFRTEFFCMNIVPAQSKMLSPNYIGYVHAERAERADRSFDGGNRTASMEIDTLFNNIFAGNRSSKHRFCDLMVDTVLRALHDHPMMYQDDRSPPLMYEDEERKYAHKAREARVKPVSITTPCHNLGNCWYEERGICKFRHQANYLSIKNLARHTQEHDTHEHVRIARA